jgi:predicted dehydrogenase
MDELRIALVGIAGYGEQYLKRLLQPEEALNGRLVAGIDAYPERSSLLAELRGADIAVHHSLEAFQAVDQADLVIIAAPIHLHAPLTCQALARGSHVLCEKPLGATVEDGQRIIQAERAAGRIVAIGYQWSFSEALGQLKADILAGTLGRPLGMKTLVLWPRRQSYYSRNAWAGRLRTSDGHWVLDSPLNNAAAHYLHNMLWLLGDTIQASARPSSVEAELWRANAIENFDSAAVRIRTESGVCLRMYTSHAVRDNADPRFELACEHAVVAIDADNMVTARFSDGRTKVYGNPNARYFGKLYQTIAAVRSGGTVPCGPVAAFAQTLCIQRIQDCPVGDVPRDRIRIDATGGDPLVWVDGLAEALTRRYLSADF